MATPTQLGSAAFAVLLFVAQFLVPQDWPKWPFWVLGGLAVALLLASFVAGRGPRLELSLHPNSAGSLLELKSKEEFPYLFDSHRSGGNFTVVRYQTVWIVPVRVKNRGGKVAARNVEVQAVDVDPPPHTPLPQSLNWRRDEDAPKYTADIPPDGTAEACLVEFVAGSGRVIFPPARDWKDPSVVRVTAHAPDVRAASMRVRVWDLLGDVRVERLRWWAR